jgi:serine/threonine protein kinase
MSFRNKAQKLGLFASPITPPENRHEPLPGAKGSTLLEKRQQKLGPLQLSKITPSASDKGTSAEGRGSSPPLVDLATIYEVNTNESLGEESQFKTAYKAKKNGKMYVLFVFKKLSSSSDSGSDTSGSSGGDPIPKEVKIFKKLIGDNTCDKYAICPVQVGLFEGSLSIVTEFIEGVTLAKLVEMLKERDIDQAIKIPITNYQLSYLYALELFQKIVKSLQFIHNVWKFVHLDIKPDNIMISHDGSSVYIIDLGSGCFSPEITKDNCEDRFAAEDFVAPESIFPPRENYWTSAEGNFENWKKADIFSLGKVFDYLKTVITFECDSQKESLTKLIEKMTDSIYEIRPTSVQVNGELENFKTLDCKNLIKQLGGCFIHLNNK